MYTPVRAKGFWSVMKISQARLSKSTSANSCMIVLMALFMVYLYEVFLFPTNTYTGVNSLFSIGLYNYFIIISGGLFLLVLLFPKCWDRPSDIFLSVYIIFVCIPYVVLFPIYGDVSFWIFLMIYSFNLLPILIVVAISRISKSLPIVKYRRLLELNSNSLAVFLMVISVFITLYAISKTGLDFSFEGASERRLDARRAFMPGAFTSYVLQATMNTFTPILMFIFIRKGKFVHCIIPLGLSALFFSLSGVKSIFLLVMLAGMFGYYDRKGRLPFVLKAILIAYFIIILVAAGELYFLDYTYVGDYLLNRLFMKNALIQEFYFDLILNSNAILSGHPNVTYLVGEQYFNNSLTNANTNGFLTSLAGKGLAIYIIELVVFSTIIFIVDLLYREDRNTLWMLLICLMTFLLVEQKLSVVLISSGILIGLGLVFLMSNKNRKF